MTPRFSAHPCVLRFERLHVAVTTGITGQTVLFSVIIIATTGPDAARNHYLLVPVVLELVERAIVPTSWIAAIWIQIAGIGVWILPDAEIKSNFTVLFIVCDKLHS